MFNYDWFHGAPYYYQCEEAKWRCTAAQFPDVPRESLSEDEGASSYCEELLVRTLVYLRDGFSYEIKEIADTDVKSHLVFECEPVDHHYRVGSFVVTVPFEEIVRVEVFSVHPSSKPDDFPQITGFHATPEGPDHKKVDPQAPRREMRDIED